MRKQFLTLAGIGFVMGMVMGNLIAWFTGGTLVNARLAAWTGSEAASIVIQTVVSGLLGAIAMGGTMVYEIERWPLLAMSVTHYLMIAVTYVAIALLLGWADSPKKLIRMLLIQLAVYFIIWLIMYLRYRAQVRKLNELLDKSTTKKD